MPQGEVQDVARRTGAVPFDVPGAAFCRDSGDLPLDGLIRHYGLASPVMERLAAIARSAGTGRLALAPAAAGQHAVPPDRGITARDDSVMMEEGMMLYDALHAWCALPRDDTLHRPQAA